MGRILKVTENYIVQRRNVFYLFLYNSPILVSCCYLGKASRSDITCPSKEKRSRWDITCRSKEKRFYLFFASFTCYFLLLPWEGVMGGDCGIYHCIGNFIHGFSPVTPSQGDRKNHIVLKKAFN